MPLFSFPWVGCLRGGGGRWKQFNVSVRFLVRWGFERRAGHLAVHEVRHAQPETSRGIWDDLVAAMPCVHAHFL